MRYLTKKTFEYFPKVLFESVLIIFSVLIALFLNEVHTQKKLEQERIRALQLIKAELNYNKALLEKWHPYHLSVLSNFETVMASPPSPLKDFKRREFFFELMPDGLVQDSLRNSTWSALKQSSITSHMRLETISAISTSYKMQNQSVEKSILGLFDMFVSRETMRKANLDETLDLMKKLVQELVAQEQFMIEHYKQSIAVIDKQLTPRSISLKSIIII